MKKVTTEAISVNCMAKSELVLDASPVNKSGNHEPISGVGFSWDPDPEPLVVPGVLMIGYDESLEDFRLQKKIK